MTLNQLSVPLTRDQAYALVDAVMERDDLALTASAHEDASTGEWVFEATCEIAARPQRLRGAGAHRRSAAMSTSPSHRIDPDVNWVAKSLEGLKPVIAGGFYVYGSHEDAPLPAGLIAIRIDAAQAFGTGHHETTTGCLEAIERTLKRSSPSHARCRHRHRRARHRARQAHASARHRQRHRSDRHRDRPSHNARDNGVGHLITAVDRPPASTTRSSPQSAPYDLIVANILAAPLVAIAPAIGRAAARAARRSSCRACWSRQAARVVTAYRPAGHGAAPEA